MPVTASAVLAVVGATATGKTALGEALAERLGAEIVCADSRQVFRELEIGTGKPSPEERRLRPHHLFEALVLGDRASAGWYGRASAAARAEIRARGALPLLVGGSGLYLRAAAEGLAEEPPHDPQVRARLRAELDDHGPEALHARLAGVDPTAAERIAPRDRQRIVRALEVQETSGRPMSWWRARPHGTGSGESWRVIELTLDGEALDARIERRTRWMLENGLVEETRVIVDAGLGPALRSLRAVGYDEALAVLEGAIDREEAEARIRRRTRQLAKRQRTWFRHQVEAHRLDAEAPLEVLVERAEALARESAEAKARPPRRC